MTVHLRPDEFSRELVIDSFAGGGGASEGIRLAIGRDPDIAVNHDRLALAMHRMNHPGTRHIAENVVAVDARALCAGRPIGMLWMSPDCKHHSKAKGGRPRDKNIRGLAWTVLGWVKRLPTWQRPRVVFLENVEEFADWGPLDDTGRPCPVQKGASFREYVRSWEALGYQVEHREMRACDYGVPTIRKRLYWIARCDGEPIVWPQPTHGGPHNPDVISEKLKPWRAAAEIIDWSLPCPSIFDSSETIKRRYGIRAIRPLAEATLARIAKGTMRYVVTAAKPFLVQLNHGGGAGGRAHDLDEPAPTMTQGRGEALVTPFVSYAQQGGLNREAGAPLHTLTASPKDQNAVITPFVTKFNRGATGHAVDEPLHTVTAHASDTHGGGASPLGVVAPHLIRVDQTSGDPARKGVHSVEDPVRTLATAGGLALVAPCLVRTAHGERDHAGKKRGRGALAIEEPAPTVLASNDAALVAPFLAPRYQEKLGAEPRVRSVEEPAATITAGDNVPGHLVTPFLVPRYGERPGQEPRTHSLEEPSPVVVPTANEGHLAAVHLSRQFGASVGSPADAPVGTITAGGAGKAAVVAAFLAQHNTERGGGGQAGQRRPRAGPDCHGLGWPADGRVGLHGPAQHRHGRPRPGRAGVDHRGQGLHAGARRGAPDPCLHLEHAGRRGRPRKADQDGAGRRAARGARVRVPGQVLRRRRAGAAGRRSAPHRHGQAAPRPRDGDDRGRALRHRRHRYADADPARALQRPGVPA